MESHFYSEFLNGLSREIVVTLLVALVASVWLGLQAQRRWLRRSFFERVSVSLNFVFEGDFKMRTLQELACVDVFRNGSVVKQVMKAAGKRKTEGILDLPPDDYWYYLNPILNSISEQFAAGYVRQEAGLGATPQTYLLCLSGGYNPTMRQGKIRALVIRESLLLEVETLQPSFRNDFHRLRWETLKEVRREWIETKGATKRIREISLPV